MEVSRSRRKEKTPDSYTAQGGRGGSGDYALHSTSPAERLQPRFVSALRRAVSIDRFASYAASASQDAEFACRLYVWDGVVAAAVLRDVAVVEVALRNALSGTLENQLGPQWYQHRALDHDSRLVSARNRAIAEIAGTGKAVTPGRVIAQLSLGFWVNLLSSPADPLWRTSLHRAFPGGKSEARKASQRYGRAWVHSQARVVQVVRNRCAHHEPLLNGFPLPGQRRRMATADGVAAYMRLTRMIDRDLADWLGQASTVEDVLASRPQPLPTAATPTDGTAQEEQT